MEKNVEYVNVIKTIQDLIAVDSIHDALRLCEKEEYASVLDIQAERLFILVKKLNKIDEAYTIWQQYRDSNNVNIVIRGIDILSKLKMNQEVLEYAENHYYDDIRYIRSYVKVLVDNEKYEEAIEICEDKKYMCDEVIRRLREKAYKKLHKPIKDEVADILTKIYADCVNVDEIKEAEIDTYSKSILMLAYYEKHNPKSGIEFIKKVKKVDNLSAEYLKTYNCIYQRLLSNKNRYFDAIFYSNLLDREINYNLALELTKKKEEEKKTIKEEIKVEKEIVKEPTIKQEKKVKEEPKMVGVVGTRISARYGNNTNTKVNNNTQEHVLLIKDVLKNELNDIGLYLYVMMQNPEVRKNAIKAWDNLENMSYKPVSDKTTLRKLANLILTVSVEHPEIVDADSRKLVKLLEK